MFAIARPTPPAPTTRVLTVSSPLTVSLVLANSSVQAGECAIYEGFLHSWQYSKPALVDYPSPVGGSGMSSDTRSNETVKKGLLDWIGYKKDVSIQLPSSPEELLGYIQKLEAEIEELRSRKDFAQMTEQELEALAAETAVQILSTVHQREEEAKKLAEKQIEDAEKQASKIISAATKKAEALETQSQDNVKKSEVQAEQTLKTANDSAFAIVQQAEASATKTKADADNQARLTIQQAEEFARQTEREVSQQLTAVRAAHEALLDLLQKSQGANEKAQSSVIAALEVLSPKPKKNSKESKSQ